MDAGKYFPVDKVRKLSLHIFSSGFMSLQRLPEDSAWLLKVSVNCVKVYSG